MNRSPSSTFGFAAVALGLGLVASGAAEPDQAGFDSTVRPFLQAYCVECHGEAKEKAGVRVDRIGPMVEGTEFGDVWREIQDQVLLGDMPPVDAEKQPTEAEKVAFLDWVAEEIGRAESAFRDEGGKVVLRRLNRNEYTETVRQLLYLHPAIDVARALPEDDSFHGFDNIGAALNISPVQMRAYVENARSVLARAFPQGEKPELFQLQVEPEAMAEYYEKGREIGRLKRENDMNKELSPAERQRRNAEIKQMERENGSHFDRGRHIRFSSTTTYTYFDDALGFDGTGRLSLPKDPGIYRFRFRVKGDPNGGDEMPLFAAEIESTFENRAFLTTDLTDRFQTYEAEALVLPEDRGLAFSVARMGNRYRYKKKGASEPRIVLDWLEIEGPIVEAWPSKAWQEYFSEADDSEESARRITEKFMERAFRRPPEPKRVEQFLAFYQDRRAAGDDFETAVRRVMQAVMASPEFLFMVESKEGSDGRKLPLDDFELATRLSYFLWSSPPDEELYGLAKAGRLQDPAVLEQQARRMLADPRVENFAKNFTGQWLKLRTLGDMAPDSRKYHEWEPTLAESMRRETEMFFLHILQNNLSISDFIDADWTMLNSRLAFFYGIDGVDGYEFRPVKLGPEDKRGGLLTQASLLTLTSDGIRTSPVKRGTFLLENVLGDPPPPPPNNVPPVNEVKGKTLRERLASHREIPACQSCHEKIDPLGFALENFNAIGKWRTEEEDSKLPVDASGSIDGKATFSGFDEFRELLAERQDDVARCLLEKLMMYALGRPVTFNDHAEMDRILQQVKANGNQLSDLVLAVTLSEPFRTK